jgi:hypothetical protein
VVIEAAFAQLDPPAGPTLRPYRRLKRIRGGGDYEAEEGALHPDDVRADLPVARKIVDIATKVVPHMPVFTPSPRASEHRSGALQVPAGDSTKHPVDSAGPARMHVAKKSRSARHHHGGGPKESTRPGFLVQDLRGAVPRSQTGYPRNRRRLGFQKFISPW